MPSLSPSPAADSSSESEEEVTPPVFAVGAGASSSDASASSSAAHVAHGLVAPVSTSGTDAAATNCHEAPAGEYSACTSPFDTLVLRQLVRKGLEWTSPMKDPWEDPNAGVEGIAGLLLRRAAIDVSDTFGICVERAAALGLAALFELTALGLRWDAWVAGHNGQSMCYMRAGHAFVFAVIQRLAVTWEFEDGRVLRGRIRTRGRDGDTLGCLTLTIIAGGKANALFDSQLLGGQYRRFMRDDSFLPVPDCCLFPCAPSPPPSPPSSPLGWEDPHDCLLYTSPSPRDQRGSRMPSSA